MKVLFIGDIIGKPGRHFLKEKLTGFRRDREIDLCIANAENGSGGFGLTPDSADTLFASGIDVLTSGNHIWDRKVVMPYLDREERLLRPANYPPGTPGKGELLISTRRGTPVGIMNLQGRAFMPAIDCPFRATEPPLARLKQEAKVIIVDFHAEATAEKLAMGWFLSGKVSAVIGTHTHVQTADERILEGGTAYITDVGMTGSIDGVIGMRKKEAIQRFVTHLPNRFVPATSDVRMMAVCIDVDETTGRAIAIERINHS